MIFSAREDPSLDEPSLFTLSRTSFFSKRAGSDFSIKQRATGEKFLSVEYFPAGEADRATRGVFRADVG